MALADPTTRAQHPTHFATHQPSLSLPNSPSTNISHLEDDRPDTQGTGSQIAEDCTSDKHLTTERPDRSRDSSPDRDVEAQGEKVPEMAAIAASEHEDPYLVTWNGPSDPENPKNWSCKRKWAATLTVSMFTFISPITSSMVAPALPTMALDLNIHDSFMQSMILSIFVLAYAFGPLLLGPSSEVFGRVRVIQIANLVFLAFNIGCGFAQTKAQIIVFRFLAGLGGCAPMAVGGGVLADMWLPEQRGRALAIYTAGPLLGPALGPIAGGFIAEFTTWRWVFWATSIYNALVQFVGYFLLRETFAPLLLSRKVKQLRIDTGNQAYYSSHDRADRTLRVVLAGALKRPFRMLFTQPIVIALAFYQAYLYGVMYLVLTTMPIVYTEVYHETIGISGLNYISLGLGFFVGVQVCGPMSDRMYIMLKRRNKGVGKPEFRIRLMVPGALLAVPGIFMYGWTVQAHVHWIAPNIGIFIYAAGTMAVFQGCQTYVIDAYTRYAASAMAAVTFLRSLAGFGFPLYGPDLLKSLGYGWGNSVLGFIAVGIGLPAPWLLWRYGGWLRSKSQFAAGD